MNGWEENICNIFSWFDLFLRFPVIVDFDPPLTSVGFSLVGTQPGSREFIYKPIDSL